MNVNCSATLLYFNGCPYPTVLKFTVAQNSGITPGKVWAIICEA